MEYFNDPLFGVILSLGCYGIGKFIHDKTKITILNPLLIAIVLIISVLIALDISYESYNEGGKIISFFLAPATVALALPLYRQLHLLREHFLVILLGVVISALTAITSVVIASKVLGIDGELLLSFLPKSVTTPIGIEVSKEIGGDPAITVLGILLTGIIGHVVAPKLLKALKVKNDIAKGIAIGSTSHAIGTSKAIEMGETVGSMSALAIGLSGIITIFIAPTIVKILL